MKKRLLLLVIASAAVISGCVTTAGYRGHGGGYYGSSSDYYRYGSSSPYGYYGNGGYSYGYDRYGYDRYGYDRYGRSYGYPQGYAPYYNNRYYYYYPVPQRPPTTGPGTNPPPQVVWDPNRPAREQIREIRERGRPPQGQVMGFPQDGQTLRDLSQSRDMQSVAPAPAYEQPRAEKRSRFEDFRDMRGEMGRSSLRSGGSEGIPQPSPSTEAPVTRKGR